MPEDRPGLDRWIEATLGRTLIAAEAALLAEAYEDVFGWDLLQLGAWGPDATLLGGSRTRRQTIVTAALRPDDNERRRAAAGGEGASPPVEAATPGAPRPQPFVVARLAQLPIANGSVDAVLLPHTLEFEADPYAIVREADRVLVGDGQLLVLGFRPLSLWGLRAAATRAGFPPGLRRLIPLRRLRDWLVLLGYEIVESRPYLYHLPWGVPRSGAEGRAQVLRRAFFNPLPAGGYLVKARKRLYTLTPVRPRFREKRAVLGGLVEPTSPNPAMSDGATETDAAGEVGARVVIYTDGACRGNPGPGGWGAILTVGTRERELSGAERETTNNRMELTAAIRALEALKRPVEATVYTDSQYVIKGITEWVESWKARGWRTADRKAVKNQELWETLDALASRHDLTWRWVRGHTGVAGNERADRLANEAIDALLGHRLR